MTTRIYLVTNTETNKHRLIRAATRAQAIRHAASTMFDIEVAGQDDLVSLLSHGIPVEMAGGPTLAEMYMARISKVEEAALANAGGTD